MPYKLISTHDNTTFKQISEKAGIEYQKGNGFYQISKVESIGTKELVLFENGKYVTDDVSTIKNLLGLSRSGDVDINPSIIPPNQQVFIQSTAPNRKIADDIPVLFYIENDDDEDENNTAIAGSSSTNTGMVNNNSIKYAINFETILSSDIEEIDGDFTQFFNLPIGTKFEDCDQPVPMNAQLPSLWYLSNITRTVWSQVDIHQEKLPYTTYESVTRVTAIGKLQFQSTNPLNPFEEYPVRLEYFWKEEWSCYSVAIGMLWGVMLGSCGGHPYVVTPDIFYGNSDGSSSEYPPIAICDCTEKVTLKRKREEAAAAVSGGGGTAGYDYDVTIKLNQKMDAICGHFLRVFSTHCSDTEH